MTKSQANKQQSRLVNDKGPLGFMSLPVATAFGLGLSPHAPGTCGTLLGVILHLVTVMAFRPQLQYGILVGIFAAVCFFHYILTPWSQRYWSDPDPRRFVLDEVAGYLVVPVLIQNEPIWLIAVMGFVGFRAFDIIKIPPARQIDRKMHGATGILLDDIVSGVYAVLAIRIILWVAAWLKAL
jgi:phosphatidylglycerophosphatase A